MIGHILRFLIYSWVVGEDIFAISAPACLEKDLSYHEHETNFSSYYMCVNGSVIPFTCPTGLYFNKKNTSCEIHCDRCDKSLVNHNCLLEERDKNKPFPKQCSKYIHCDQNGSAIIRKCKTGLLFSPELGHCVIPEISNCPYEQNEKLETCPATKKCNLQDAGLQYPYPPDCSKYIFCREGGITQIRKCVYPKEFSPTELYCMDAQTAGCHECSNAIPTTTVIKTTTTKIKTTTTTVPVCPPIQKCPTDTIGITLPYPEDCTKYIYCDYNGVTKFRTCTNNKHYSPTLQYCEVPEIAKCSLCYPATTTTPITEQVCPATPSCSPLEHGNTKPYPPECSKYIYCNSNGDEIVRMCPEGYHYSTQSRYCLRPEIANCIDCVVENSTDITTLEPVTINCNELPSCADYFPGASLPYGLDCQKYIYCDKSGQPNVRICPFGYEFSSQLFYCTTPDIAQCHECDEMSTVTTVPICAATPTCTILDTGELKPYPPDCTKYIYCNVMGYAEISSCPIDTAFNSVTKTCVTTELSDCIHCIEGSTTTNDYFTTTIESTFSTTTTSGTATSDTSLPFCPPIPECSHNNAGELRPYPPDCTKYIYCSENGNATISWCSEGEYYDHDLNRCSHDAECVECLENVSETPIPYCPDTPTCLDTDIGKVKPFPADCSKYIYCDEFSVAKISSCPYLEHFSPSALLCTLPSIASCPICEEILPTNEVCPDTPTCSVNDTGLFKPFPPDCSKYIYCDSDLNSIESICPYGTQFDSYLLTCSDSAICHSCVVVENICPPTPGCSILEAGDVKPYPPDCSKYIYCNSMGEAVISVCPKGEYFSTVANKCVDADQVICITCTEVTTEPSTVTNVSPETTTIGNITNTDSTISATLSPEPVTSDETTDSTFSITETASSFTFSDTTATDATDSTLSMTESVTSSTDSDETPTDPVTETTFSITEVDTTPIITTTRVPLPPCPPEPHCKANDNNNRLPYPPECRMYIKCKRSSPDEYWLCPEGKEFSPVTHWCEFPLIANCTRCDSDHTLPPVQGTETPPMHVATISYFRSFNHGIYHPPNDYIFRGIEDIMALDRKERNFS